MCGRREPAHVVPISETMTCALDIASGERGISWREDGAATLGAQTTVAAIAADARLGAAYPEVAASAQDLATPQVRHLATLGGNLAQRSRCWYFRKPHND